MFFKRLPIFMEILDPYPAVRRCCWIALTILLAASAASIASLILFKTVLNDFLLHSSDISGILIWLSLYVSLQLVGRFLSDYAFWVYIKFDQGAQKALGHYVFQHLQRLSLHVYLEQQLGSLARTVDHGFSGFRNLFYILFTGIIPLLFDLVMTFGLLYYYYGFQVSLLALSFIGIFCGVTAFLCKKIDAEQLIWMEHARTAFGRCFDNLINYETVKYFGNENRVAQDFHQGLDKLESTVLQAKKSTTQLSYIQSLLIALLMASLLSLLGFRVTMQQLSVADLVMVNLYMLQLTRPLSSLGQQLRALKTALHELEALFTLLSKPTEPADPAHAVDLSTIETIEFQKVAFSHDARQPLFQNFNLTLQVGERVAIVGASGSGKTTLTRLLFRLYEIDQGMILINGQDFRNYPMRSLRDRLSIVPQEVVLFNDTLHYNIQFGNHNASFLEIEQATQQAGIHDFILSLPQQYQTVVGERGMKLSGGERQRIGIARAILKNPDLYIFDEATSALDTHTERAIQQQIFAITKNKTLLIIAHRLSTVISCDRILVMQAGKIVEQGTHQALLRSNGHYASLWKAQKSTVEAG
jgi:ATP-binding cassette subfamily B protein